MATIEERINKAKQDNRKVNGKGTAAQSIEERIRMAKQDSAPVMGGTHSAPSGAAGTTSPIKGEAGGVGTSTATLGKSDIEQRMKQAGATIFSANQRIAGYSRAGNMGKALEEERERLKAAQAEYDSLKRQLALLKQNETLAKRAQEFAEGNETYNALTQQDDFTAYSSMGASKDNSGSVPGNIVRHYRENEHPLYSTMTEREVSIYDYLLGKGDDAGAQKYLEFLNEDLRRREGEAKAQEIQDIENPVKRTLATGAHAFKAGVDNAMQGTVQFFREEEMPTSATQFASAALMEDMGTWGRYAYSAVNTVGNMLPSIVVGTLTGGAGGAAAMGLSSSGNAYKQALTEGYDKSDARAYSVLVGASEAALQYAIGGISKLGGVADDVLLAKAAKLDKAYKRMLATGAIKLGSEITEEEVQLFLEPAIKSIIMDVPYDAPNFEEMVETAIVTALSTGTLEGGNILAAGVNRPVQSGQTKNAASGVETAVNENGLTALTEQEKTNLSSGKKNKVISTFNEAVGFIKNALSNKQSVDRAYLGKVPDGVAKRVLEETGVDITGYNAILPSDAVRHMFKNHGNETAETAQGQVALTAETAANITTVLSNPDRVYLSDKTDARGLSTLIFEKQIGDYYITAQAVSDGTHSIQTDTLYVQKKKNPQDTVSDASVSTAPEHNARSVPPQGSSTNNTIPHPADSVNSGAAQGFGENGTKVVAEIAQNKGTTIQQVQNRVGLAYQTGRSNLPGTLLDLTDTDQQRAYNAGQMDYLAENPDAKDLVTGQKESYTDIKTEVPSDGAKEVHLRGSGQRADGTHSSGAISAVESRTGGNQVRQEQGRPADPEAASLTYGEAVSTASLGIGKGSDKATIRVVTGGDTADTRAAKQLAKERGLRLTLFVGGNLNINGESVRAYITGDRAFVRADHPDFTSAQLMRHEAGHDMIAKGEIDPQTVRERIAERFGGEHLDHVTQMYIEAYAGSGLTAEEIWNEIICDSLGDMNIFSETASEDAARELLTDTKAASADAKAETDRGPPQSIAGKASREITTPAAQNAIFNALDHKDNGDDNLILLSQMPGAIRDIADVDGDLYVYRNHLYENMVDEKRAQTEGRYNPNGHYHELGEEVMEQALTALNHPSIVIADEMKAGNPALTLILPIFDKRDWPIHAVLSFYDRSAINGKTEKRPHIAVTFYGHYYEDDGGRKTVVDLVNDAIDGDRVLLLDKKVRADLPLIAERAPLGNVTVSALKRNIAQFQKRVKQFKTANKINYSIELEPAKIERAAERYSALIEEYGAIAPGENPARDVQVPKRTADNQKVSRTVRTILEARATPEEIIPDVEKLVADGDFSYEKHTDKQAISNAENTIRRVGWAQALSDWMEDTRKGVVSKRNTAMGWALYNNAANSGDVQTAITILDQMVAHQRSAAQALQATRILKKLSPETQLYQVQRSVENLQEELNERFGEKGGPVLKVDKELAEQFMRAKGQEERDAVLKDIYRDIGRQMPSTFRDKWNAWRYLAMLCNARTHVRNIVGNAGFAPVVLAKNLTASAIEETVYRVSGGRTERSKGLLGVGKQDRDLLSAAWEDYSTVQETAMNGGKYSDFANANRYIEEGRVIFKNRALEKARKGNSKALDVEDQWFFRPHYAAALAQYCKANGITASQIRSGVGMDRAHAYAVKEAQKATYRDTNAFSQAISELGRAVRPGSNSVRKGIGVAVEGTLPFRKTPANILVRGLEYSPAGFLKSITWDLVQVKLGNKTAAEAIDNISAGLTGSGLLSLGIYLAAQGLVRGHGGDDEDEIEFEELMGHQAYALELPDGTSVTLDWLAPEALPFFVGVNLWEHTGGERATLADWMQAAATVTEPMLEMSCLQSLNDVFDAVGYAQSSGLDGLPAALATMVTSYLTQALPTLLGQAERSAEDTRMSTYTEKNAFLTSDMQYTIGRASARLPGWDYRQIPYIDAWGRTERGGIVAERVGNNFLNPAYTSTVETSPMEDELLRLYEQTGEGSVLPSRAAKHFNVDGERKDLTAQEYVKYATAKGQTAYKVLTALSGTEAYRKMSDSDKVEAVGLVYDYANATAKTKVSGYKPEGWIAKAVKTEKATGVKAEQYVTLYLAQKDIESLKEADGDTIANSKSLLVMEMVYNVKGLTDAQRRALFEDFGVGKTVIHWNKALVQEKLKAMRKKAA